ncbi:MAG: SDR family oxidoreductase [Acidobacteria bacterium]|nr:SDR family oxidoreductase [Acidobacteriota bacterium]
MSTPRVALVTGCGKRVGLGSASARALAAQGVAVAVSDIAARGVANAFEGAPPEAAESDGWLGLDSLVEEIVAAGGRALALRGDVSVEADAQRLVDETLAHFGRLDILVNNAAAPHGADRGDIETVPVEAWDAVMAINVRGPFLMSRAAVRPMRAQHWGRIINIASVSGVYGLKNMGAYSASKAALIGFTRALAMDVAAADITVNAVCPGTVWTSRTESSARRAGFANAAEALAQRSKGIPLGRAGRPDEVGAMVAFLASEPAGYITGQSIVIDGGKGSLPQVSKG